MKIYLSLLVCFALIIGPNVLAEDRLGTSPKELDRLRLLNASDKVVTMSDQKLSKLMVGTWTTGRHDYVYRPDGTWQMLPIELGGTNGTWSITDRNLIEGKTKRLFIEADEELLVLKNTEGAYPYRYAKITPPLGFPNDAAAKNDEPDQVVLDLLKWYLPVSFKIGSDVILDERMDDFIDSDTLAKWRKSQRSEHGYGAVPFVGQNYEEAWANNHKITKKKNHGDGTAEIIVRYSAPQWTQDLKFLLVKTNSGWRIKGYEQVAE